MSSAIGEWDIQNMSRIDSWRRHEADLTRNRVARL